MNPVRGIALKITSVLLFLAMFSLVKSVAAHVPAGEAVFFRSLFAIPPIIAWLAWQGPIVERLRAKDPIGHLWRGFMGSCAMGLGFFAIGILPLPEAVAIGYTSPLLVTILAAMFLAERVRLIRLAALLLGMIGVGLVMAPRLTLLGAGAPKGVTADVTAYSAGSTAGVDAVATLATVGALAALLAAVFSALAQVFARRLVATETTGAIVFWFSIMSTTFALATLPLGWVRPSGAETAMLVCAGLLGGIGQICLTESYRHAEAAVIASFDYSSMLFALVIGYYLFGEVPTRAVLAGAAMIVLAGLIILVRERQLGLARGRARGAVPPDA